MICENRSDVLTGRNGLSEARNELAAAQNTRPLVASAQTEFSAAYTLATAVPTGS
jgi:hypothetical protein